VTAGRGWWWLAVLALVSGAAARAGAQVRSDSAGAYRPPTANQRWRDGAWNAAGPTAIGGSLVSAAWGQWVTDEPPEWDADGRGFARRFGVASATTAITETSLAALSAAMRQDARYHRCARRGVLPRVGHALRMTFMARRADGRAVFSVARTTSPFIGPLVTRATLYPARDAVADGLESGAYAVLMNAGWNLAREFVLAAPAW
jgi:hypothetical protein